MVVSLTIIRYRKRFIPFAILAMAVHHIPLWLNRQISFYKLLGCGRNGTFDKNPDWQQWGILTALPNSSSSNTANTAELTATLYGQFISNWFKFFNAETWTILLEPIEGHGTWDGKEAFGKHEKQSSYTGPVAVLTRATIRLSKLSSFWKNVGSVALQMNGASGFVTSVGIGEMPFIKQATFSIWQSKEAMKAFAYQMREHQEVIKKTRKENWYSEDMFTRFRPLRSTGTIRGVNPLEGML